MDTIFIQFIRGIGKFLCFIIEDVLTPVYRMFRYPIWSAKRFSHNYYVRMFFRWTVVILELFAAAAILAGLYLGLKFVIKTYGLSTYVYAMVAFAGLLVVLRYVRVKHQERIKAEEAQRKTVEQAAIDEHVEKERSRFEKLAQASLEEMQRLCQEFFFLTFKETDFWVKVGRTSARGLDSSFTSEVHLKQDLLNIYEGWIFSCVIAYANAYNASILKENQLIGQMQLLKPEEIRARSQEQVIARDELAANKERFNDANYLAGPFRLGYKTGFPSAAEYVMNQKHIMGRISNEAKQLAS